MSDLRTTSEITVEIENAISAIAACNSMANERRLRQAIAAHDLVLRQKWLEEACGLQCEWCKQGIPVIQSSLIPDGSKYVHTQGFDFRQMCTASALRRHFADADKTRNKSEADSSLP